MWHHGEIVRGMGGYGEKVIKSVRSVGKSVVVCCGNEHGVRYEGGVI